MPLLPLTPARPRLPTAAGAALGATARRAAGPFVRWSVDAQLTARRNAMVASTALAQRRAEREEVEELVAALWATRSTRVRRSAAPAALVRPAAHG
jgi:hypothetical protein